MRTQTCTQDGVTACQPGVSVSYVNTQGNPATVLRVSRHYGHLRNRWGGHGVSKPLDADGRTFPTLEDAQAFALAHGYVRRYVTAPDLRALRVARARRACRPLAAPLQAA